MRILIKKAKVIAENSSHHKKVVDILIVDGFIMEIGSISTHSDKLIDGKDLCVSNGFLDMRAFSKEPGMESMETLESLSNAAAKGGFTEVVLMPNTTPVVQSKESVKYLKNFSKQALSQLLPAGAVTKDNKGQELTEMWDLLSAGAIAFTDGENPIWDSSILYKTLQYLYPKKALLINRAEDKALSAAGQMHEGFTSTQMGTKGIPSEAEEIMIARDIKLLEYADLNHDKSLLHFTCVSTTAGIDLIRKAKKKGLPVSCDIAAHQLAFIDEDLQDFNTNLKVNPPFRTKKDIKSIQKGISDGTIDAIVSDHHPLDEEHKNLEFDLASFGILGLQTAFSVANTFGNQDIETLVNCLTKNPRSLLGVEEPIIEPGKLANMTIFCPNEPFTLALENIVSLSKNSPFIGKQLKGRVIACLNKGKIEFNK